MSLLFSALQDLQRRQLARAGGTFEQVTFGKKSRFAFPRCVSCGTPCDSVMSISALTFMCGPVVLLLLMRRAISRVFPVSTSSHIRRVPEYRVYICICAVCNIRVTSRKVRQMCKPLCLDTCTFELFVACSHWRDTSHPNTACR